MYMNMMSEKRKQNEVTLEIKYQALIESENVLSLSLSTYNYGGKSCRIKSSALSLNFLQKVAFWAKLL